MKKQGKVKLVALVMLALLFGVLATISISNQCCTPGTPPPNNTANKGTAVLPAGEAGNPLAIALKSGMPVVADFGRGTCIPCKMMKPILEELKETYKGKAEIFIFSIDEYRDLTEQCKINLIPTQIFYDKTGKEVMRHEGFFPKDEIVAKLKELGVN